MHVSAITPSWTKERTPGNPFAGSNKSSEGLAFRPGNSLASHKDSE